MRFVNPIKIDPAAITFLHDVLGTDGRVSLVSGDASFRRYFRVETDSNSFILMEAPPDKEDSVPFVDISAFLDRHGIAVPRVIKSRLDLGYLLLDDFGDTTFLLALDDGASAQTLYHEAVDVLLDIQSTPNDSSCIAHSRPYDRALMSREFALFTDWYIEGICKKSITPADKALFNNIFTTIIDYLLTIPTRFVHRDYHSRNLMWQSHKVGRERVGVIDFQDGVMGPITYDLASLLRDCYVAWDRPFRDRVSEQWLQGARERLGYNPTPVQFKKDFDWMALQRNLKAVGIFGRLSLRDGKHGYLKDIPRTLSYVTDTLPDHPELATLHQLIIKYVQ
ncbi:MAG: phosphotransferase [Magnetococcales bacterium]|nr:phosphotransferase [Magnetococcales bacterium]